MRWEDNSLGANVSYDWGSINQAFAAGTVGMYMGGSDLYLPLKQQNDLDPDTYGLAVLPQKGDKAGCLAGGALAVASANSTPEQAAAVVDWFEFSQIKRLVDKDSAVERAKVDAEAKQPVGIPGMPVFDKATWDEQQQWIKDYINVPLDQFKPYTDKIFDVTLIPEPRTKTQEVYAALDPLVQEVLTNQSADIDALCKEYQGKIQAIIG